MKLSITQKTDFRKAAMVYRAINHKLRQSILEEINEKELTVTEIWVKFRIEQSVASQHLGILRRAELVTTRREGKMIYYKVNPERIAELQRASDILNK